MSELLHVALALFLVGCGGPAGGGGGTTPVAPGPSDDDGLRSIVVVADALPPITVAATPERRFLVVERAPSAADRAAGALAAARTLATQFEHAEALASVGEAQRLLEAEAAVPADYEALHLALAYRGLIESNLDRPERAEAALRAAARLRPDAELDEVVFPPDIRELYARLATEHRAERPAALTVTTVPTGATVYLDGIEVGTGPASISTSPGQHYLRVEALGYDPRVLPLQIEPEGNRPLTVELPPLTDAAALATQVFDAPRQRLRRLDAARLRLLADGFEADVLAVYDASEATLLAIDLSSGRFEPGDVPPPPDEGEPEDALEPLVAGLRDRREPERPHPAPPPDEESSTVFESPWFWVITGAVLAAGAGVGAYLLFSDTPDPVINVSVRN